MRSVGRELDRVEKRQFEMLRQVRFLIPSPVHERPLLEESGTAAQMSFTPQQKQQWVGWEEENIFLKLNKSFNTMTWNMQGLMIPVPAAFGRKGTKA